MKKKSSNWQNEAESARKWVRSIPRRLPIVEGNVVPNAETIQRQWAHLVLGLRKEMQNGSERVHQVLMGMIQTPVSETLPREFIEELKKSSPSVTTLQKTREDLINCLSLPTVPPEHIGATYRGGKKLWDPNEILEDRLESAEGPKDVEAARKSIEQYQESGFFEEGTTYGERHLSSLRYCFARDIKMLALVAALADGQVEIDANGDAEIHGIRIHIDLEKKHEVMALLDWHILKNRKKIKDRVHVVNANGKKYLLKEQKTDRHEHVPGDGDVFLHCNDAETDFAIAKRFETDGQYREGRIAVTWEKPVGFVKFPDGFQFGIFEFQKGLTHTPREKLTHALHDRLARGDEELLAEYIAMREQYKDLTSLARYRKYCERVRESWEDIVAELHIPTPKEFVRVKAHWMQERARKLLRDVVTSVGYANTDQDGYAFLVDEEQALLTIFGFDFERFVEHKLSPEEKLRRFEQRREWEKVIPPREYGLDDRTWGEGATVTPTEQAIYFALKCTVNDEEED